MRRLSVNIVVVNENCGFLGGVEQNIADTVRGLKKQKGHSCHLVYHQKTANDSEKYSNLFDSSLQTDMTGKRPDLPSPDSICRSIKPDVLYFHKIPSLRPFQKSLSACHAVRMIHDHDMCCPRRHKYFSFSNRICHYPAGMRCWLDGAFIKRDRNRRFGFTFHSIPETIREMKLNYHFSRLLVGSSFMKQELVSNGFREDRVSILPPIGAESLESERSSLPVENNLLYVGQLIRGKGVDLLLKAMSKLQVDFRLTIVGQGNDQNRLQRLSADLGLSDNVVFTGWVDHDQLDAYYKNAKIILVPSRWPEPFGMVGLEAMKHSRPVVAFDAGGIQDWLIDGETGILVPEQDFIALAAAVSRLLMDPETATSFGKKGAERVQAHFRFDDYLDRLESYLEPPKIKPMSILQGAAQ